MAVSLMPAPTLSALAHTDRFPLSVVGTAAWTDGAVAARQRRGDVGLLGAGPILIADPDKDGHRRAAPVGVVDPPAQKDPAGPAHDLVERSDGVPRQVGITRITTCRRVRRVAGIHGMGNADSGQHGGCPATDHRYEQDGQETAHEKLLWWWAGQVVVVLDRRVEGLPLLVLVLRRV